MKRVIVISGGSDGLGKAIARLLSSENAVVILAPNPEKTQSVAKELNCDFEACDITKWNQVEKAVQNIIFKHKRIDVLINNAGLWIIGELDENDPEYIRKVIEVNYLGTVLLSKAVIPQMKKQQDGLIINIISQGGLYAKTKRSVYQSSKWAVTGLTKCLEHDLKNYGIRVTGLYPGKMDTSLFQKGGEKNKDMSDSLKPEEVAKSIEFLLSLPRHINVPELGIKHFKG